MHVVGLTGGIGSGKSTFAALLAERGAQIIDADALGRDALRTGATAWQAVVSSFGDEILTPHTLEIDRKRLAGIVFNSKEKLATLNAIVHPVIMRGIADHLERLSSTDAIVVLDAALMIDLGLDRLVDTVIVVTARDELRRARLVEGRGMTPGDVDARIRAQVPTERLIEKADIVVRNDGRVEHLAREADRVYRLLEESARGAS